MEVNTPPILLHIPHASSAIPAEFSSQFCLSEQELCQEQLRLVDWHTDALYELEGAVRLESRVSRFVLDVERFSDDALEPMAARGMGAVYLRGTRGQAIRRELTAREREAVMDAYYWPHHNALDAWAQNALQCHASCLLIDCHSFPSTPLPCDLNQDGDRPDICLGTDGFHTPPELSRALKHHFEAASYRVEIDSPYAGCMVPNRCWQLEPRCHSIMIEVNRKLYMDEVTGARLPQFEAVKHTVSKALSLASELQTGSVW